MAFSKSLPKIIQECINEVLGEKNPDLDLEPEEQKESQLMENDFNRRWELWFNFIINKSDLESARLWLDEKENISGNNAAKLLKI